MTEKAQVDRSVDLTIDDISEHTFWADLALDIAEGGIFLATYRAISIGTLLDLRVSLPDGGEPIAVAGVVRWTRPHNDDSDAVAGLGVKFVELTADARERVTRFTSFVREPMLFDLEDPPMRKRRTAAA